MGNKRPNLKKEFEDVRNTHSMGKGVSGDKTLDAEVKRSNKPHYHMKKSNSKRIP